MHLLSLVFLFSNCLSMSIFEDDCDGDGSVVPDCKEHLTPELNGLSFFLPHEFSNETYWCFDFKDQLFLRLQQILGMQSIHDNMLV